SPAASHAVVAPDPVEGRKGCALGHATERVDELWACGACGDHGAPLGKRNHYNAWGGNWPKPKGYQTRRGQGPPPNCHGADRSDCPQGSVRPPPLSAG